MKKLLLVLILMALAQCAITYLKSTPPLESQRKEIIEKIVEQSVRGK